MRATDFDAWLLDLDGVVYIGPQLLPGVQAAIASLRARGKYLRFLTNDPRPTREQLVERLRRLGLETTVEEVVTCGWATARVLPELGVRTALVVGSAGLAEEIRRAGVSLRPEAPVDAVVVGADEGLSFRDVVQACLAVQRGARFIATNVDGWYPMPFGLVPATGAVVRAIEVATGKRPYPVGKPEPAMFRMAVESLPPGATALVVGDNIESDVLGAHRTGLPAVLVADSAPVLPADDPRRPDAVVGSLRELLEQEIELPVTVSPARWPERVVAGVFVVLFDDEEAIALLSSDGEWVLPWTIVFPVESLEAAARRLAEQLAETVVEFRGIVGYATAPDGGLVTDADGALLRLVGPCFAARVRRRTEWDGPIRWVPRDRLPTTLRSAHRRWVEAMGT